MLPAQQLYKGAPWVNKGLANIAPPATMLSLWVIPNPIHTAYLAMSLEYKGLLIEIFG